MSEDLRESLTLLVREFSAYVAWQRELGVVELSREGPLPVARPSMLPGPVAKVEEDAAPAIPVVMPSLAFGRMTPPVSPVTVAPPVAPKVTSPPPVVRTLFGESVEAPVSLPVVREKGPPLEGTARIDALRVIADEVAACTRCGLSARRKNTVFARGNPFARIVFIGEGPGEQEDLQGLPFVGPAGQLLDRIIAAMGLHRDNDVYVANIVKCRPPGNRVPESDEMRACTPFLIRQLDLVRPDVIVALGKTAVSFLLDSKDAMSRLRGKWHSYEGIPVLPTWHPAYLLRTPEAKADTWADMKLVLTKLGLPLPSRGA